MEHLSLLKNTVAYKMITADKEKNSLCHAYLIFSQDGKYLRDTLKEFAKVIVCGNTPNLFGLDGEEKRIHTLIDSENYPDVIVLPKEQGKITVADVDFLIEDSIIKPLEGNEKVYILSVTDEMTAQAQNKLLKTLEEPPKGVHILIGAISEENILQTVKSRAKKLVLPLYDQKALIEELQKTRFDKNKLEYAVSLSNGTFGDAERLYDDIELEKTYAVVIDLINNMNSSKDVLGYSAKVLALKERVGQFTDILELTFKDMLNGKVAGEEFVKNKTVYQKINNLNYNADNLIGVLEKVLEAKKRRKSNANETMVVDFLLYGILEERYKWQKL